MNTSKQTHTLDTNAIEARLAAGPEDGMECTPFWEAQIRQGRTCVTLPNGTVRFINVTAEMIRQSLENGGQTPVMSIRDRSSMYSPKTCREIEIMGDVQMRFTPEAPLPCTGDRGIAYNETEAAVRCYLDPGVTELPYEYAVYHQYARVSAPSGARARAGGGFYAGGGGPTEDGN